MVLHNGSSKGERDHVRLGLGFAGHDLGPLYVLNLPAKYTIILQHPSPAVYNGLHVVLPVVGGVCRVRTGQDPGSEGERRMNE
jgi:hypothetical protein